MFYTYSQNNSGGSFTVDKDRGLTVYVIIEADSASEADTIAEEIGMYWNGVCEGMDCPCCGDRWYPQYGDKGEDVPTLYGTPVSEKDFGGMRWVEKGMDACIHYKDGRKEWY